MWAPEFNKKHLKKAEVCIGRECCEYNNKDEDNSLYTLNDKNYYSLSKKLRQMIVSIKMLGKVKCSDASKQNITETKIIIYQIFHLIPVTGSFMYFLTERKKKTVSFASTISSKWLFCKFQFFFFYFHWLIITFCFFLNARNCQKQ